MATDLDRAAPAAEEFSPRPASLIARWRHSEHARGLLLIGLFKLSKSALSVALGVGALRLLHRDVADVLLRTLDALRIDPENRIVSLLMNKADLISPHQLRQFSIVTFCYAGLCLVEGTGLILEKGWAEYFTLTLTLLALPWECYEIAKHFTVVKVILLVVNLLVVVYLVWLLRRKRRSEGGAAGASQAS